MIGLDISLIGLVLFVHTFFIRYLRLLVGIGANIFFKPKPVSFFPSYLPCNVSVIIPTTFKEPLQLVECLERIRAEEPRAIYVVTSENNVGFVKDILRLNGIREGLYGEELHILGVEQLNKRAQIIKALRQVKTEICVLADDDVFWPDNYLSYLLACFEDSQVGAAGTRQRVVRKEKPDFWNFLGIAYLERRVFNNAATNAIDGSISTLSGRTAAFRSEILQTEEFYHYFTNDAWRGKPLNSDDDKCLTRFIYSHGHKIALQFDSRSVIETTVEDNPRYISQCLRWARAHWRGNLVVMENESYWRSLTYAWGCYYIYFGSFLTPSIVIDSLLFWFLWMALLDASPSTAILSYATLGSWMFFTKIVKLLPHFLRHPSDIRFIPASILFSYAHGLLNVYAYFTLHKTHWGSQSLEQLQRPRDKQEIDHSNFNSSVMEHDPLLRQVSTAQIPDIPSWAVNRKPTVVEPLVSDPGIGDTVLSNPAFDDQGVIDRSSAYQQTEYAAASEEPIFATQGVSERHAKASQQRYRLRKMEEMRAHSLA